MRDALWTTVYGIGAVQGAFLCAALLVRSAPNPLATRLLAAIVGVFTLMIVAGLLTQVLVPPLSHLVLFLNTSTELAIGPTLLLFARSLFDRARRLVRRDALHFVPLLLGVVAWGSAWLALGDGEQRLAFLDHHPAARLWVLFKACWFFGYVAATYRLLRYHERASRVHAAGRGPVDLSWLRRWLLVLSAMAAAIYLTHFAGQFGLQLPIESDPLANLVLTVTVYLAALMVLQRPWVLALQPRPAADTRWVRECARLHAHLRQQRPWLRPDLRLTDLAGELGTTENRLSTAIHEGLGTTFYALVNRYRLAEFERLAREPGSRRRSVLDLAFEAGFNSKASFYRVFREAHGTTPRAFRDAL